MSDGTSIIEEENDTIVVEGSEENMRAALEEYAEAENGHGPITISVFVYYTTAFKNVELDVRGYIDRVCIN